MLALKTYSGTRRDVLGMAIRAGILPGGMEFLAKWMKAAGQHEHSSSSAPPELLAMQGYRAQFFSEPDFEALQALTEILIPTDETPGAREAHCAQYIDFLLHAFTGYEPDTQELWRKAIAALKAAGFHAADQQGRERIVGEMARPERDHTASHPAYFAYRLVKKENAFAFYTARAGMIEALEYKGNSYNISFPGCHHPEHNVI